MGKFCDLIGRCADRPTTRAQCLTALMKLVAQHGACPARVAVLVQTLRHSASLDVQQRATEFSRLLARFVVLFAFFLGLPVARSLT